MSNAIVNLGYLLPKEEHGEWLFRLVQYPIVDCADGSKEVSVPREILAEIMLNCPEAFISTVDMRKLESVRDIKADICLNWHAILGD